MLFNLKHIYICIFIFNFTYNRIQAQKNKLLIPEAPKKSIQNINKLMKIPTQINLPISISINEIEKQINKSFTGLIFEDNSFEDNNNDLLKLKVWKIDDVNILIIKNEILEINIPLKIWVKKGFTVLGITTYQETEFKMSLKFLSKISFNSNWGINSDTKFKAFTWIEKPKLKFGLITIPIASFVEKTLNEKLKQVSSQIDQQIGEKINFKSNVLKTWNEFSKPILVSQEYKTWLQITPINIQATPLKITNQKINTTFGFNVFSETFLGEKPEDPKEIKTIPKLSLVPLLEPLFLLQTTANISYSVAQEMANNKLKNKEFSFKDEKYKIKIEDIDIYPSDDKLVIKIKTIGSIKGNIYLKGVPFYDYETKELRLKEVKFDVKTSNLLHKVAAWFLEGKITKLIEENYGIPCEELLNITKDKLDENLNKDHSKEFKLTGKIEELQPNSIHLEEDYLSLIIDIKAKLNLEVNDFNSN